MNLDFKEFSSRNKIFRSPSNSGLTLSYSFPTDLITYKGRFVTNQESSISQSYSFKNPQVSLNLSLSSLKQYKVSFFFDPQTKASIYLYAKIKNDASSKIFMNNFEVLYRDQNKQVSLGVINEYIGIYARRQFKGVNFGIYTAALHDFSQSKTRLFVWKNWKSFFCGLDKEIGGMFEGSFHYNYSQGRCVAGKVTSLNNIVQMLLGFKAKLDENREVRVRMDSDGLVGFELQQRINDWVSLKSGMDISVKSLAQEKSAFMGFGVSVEIKKDNPV